MLGVFDLMVNKHGGAGRGQGRKKGSTKPGKLKRVRIPMTTIAPENHAYLVSLKRQGHNLGKVFDQMIECFKALRK